MPFARAQDIADFVPFLNDTCEAYGITTPVRQAAFLAQITVESDHLWHQREHYGSARGEEYASGKAYEGRKDLGDIHPGDGVHYKGRGLLQVTGLANYTREGEALGLDLVKAPELLCEPEHSCDSAGLYWKTHGCNELADAGNFIAITKKINGGTNGEDQREKAWARAKAALSI
jgi:putative chitinase